MTVTLFGTQTMVPNVGRFVFGRYLTVPTPFVNVFEIQLTPRIKKISVSKRSHRLMLILYVQELGFWCKRSTQ